MPGTRHSVALMLFRIAGLGLAQGLPRLDGLQNVREDRQLTGDMETNMVDVVAGLSAFAGMVGMARGLKDLNDAVVRNEAVIALTEKIMDTQGRYTELAQQIGALEAKLAAYETWEREKQRYELKPVGNKGALAYALKEGVQPPEPPHSICPDCYQKREKSILVPTEHYVMRAESLRCHVCGWETYTRGSWMPEHSGPPRKRLR